MRDDQAGSRDCGAGRCCCRGCRAAEPRRQQGYPAVSKVQNTVNDNSPWLGWARVARRCQSCWHAHAHAASCCVLLLLTWSPASTMDASTAWTCSVGPRCSLQPASPSLPVGGGAASAAAAAAGPRLRASEGAGEESLSRRNMLVSRCIMRCNAPAGRHTAGVQRKIGVRRGLALSCMHIRCGEHACCSACAYAVPHLRLLPVGRCVARQAPQRGNAGQTQVLARRASDVRRRCMDGGAAAGAVHGERWSGCLCLDWRAAA